MFHVIRRGIALLAAGLALQPAALASAEQETGTAGRVLVIGATGRQGGATARELLARGIPVRALTRKPEGPAARALAELGAEVVRGDLDDADSLRRALAGIDRVFAITDFWEHDFAGEVRHGRQIIDAAKAAQVRHFVYSSVGSADRSTGVAHFDSKFEIERYLRASGVPFTILRPVSFMENWDGAHDEIAAGELRDPQRPDARQQYISVRDIGRFAAEAFEHPQDWIGRALDIAGDEVTVRELAEILSRVSGRVIVHRRISWQDYERAAGPESTSMMRWFDEVGYDVDVAGLRARYPWLIRLEDHLRQSGWAER